jgi:GntR family transcriptional repressor for pyruvate dehydrogenase complex
MSEDSSSMNEDTTDNSVEGIRRLSTMSAVDRVAGELLRLIRTNHFAVGDKLLAEPELARRLGVGRSTLREAKHVLAAKGFLESRGKVGTFVAEQDQRRIPLDMLQTMLAEQRVENLHEARNILEVGAIQLACRTAKDQELDALDAQLDALSTVETDEEFWSGTVKFHESIVQTCHNATINYMYKSLSGAMRTNQLPLSIRESDRKTGVELHRRLIDVLRTRDPRAAAAEMTKHLEQSHDHDLDVLHSAQKKPENPSS